jgi:hypothetical protein
MKANELRIGNYYNHNGEIKQVTPSVIEAVYESERVWCKPIQLTEEWLLRFGFEAKNTYSNFMNNEIEIASSVRVVKTNERKHFYLDGEIPEFMKIRIETVHQLQNLYFALTDQELTLNN